MQNSPVSALAGLVTAKASALDSASAPDPSSASPASDVSFESLLAQQTQTRSASQAKDLVSLLGQQDEAKGQVGKDDALAQDDPTASVTDLAALLATLMQGAATQRSSSQSVASSELGADAAKLDGVTAAVKAAALPSQGAMLVAGGVGGGSKPDALSSIAEEASVAQETAAKPDVLSLLPGMAPVAARGAVSGSKPDALPIIAEGGDVAGGYGAQAVRAAIGKETAEIAGTGKDLPLAALKLNETPVKAGELVATANTIQSDLAAHTSHGELFSQVTGVHDSNGNAPVTVVVEPRVAAPGWDSALGQKVVWLVNQRHQTAEMQLNPPNLGPLEVKITISNDQASALFVSHHAAVRDAIEAAIPRLREMLAENGITLGNVQVGAESFQREQAQAGNREGRGEPGWQPEGLAAVSAEAMVERTGVIRLRTPGTVDVFA